MKLRQIVDMITPWPSRKERRVAIEEAARNLEEERKRLERAKRTQAEIEMLQAYSGNHFAQRIANQIARGYHPQGGR